MLCPKVLLLSLVVVLTAWDSSHAAEDKLKLVKIVLIHRHGNRTPGSTYPNDIYPPGNRTIWPDGPGQLTMDGKRRMLRLGRFLRQRFSDFLSDSPSEAHVKSSHVERVLMSGELVMTGLYPPKGRLVIEEGLNWQPVPIITRDAAMDKALTGVSHHQEGCPAGKAAVAANQAKYEAEYNLTQEVYEPIEKGAGMKITTPCDVLMIWDALNSAVYDGKKLPDWVTPDLMKRMEEISEVCWRIFSTGTKLARLNGGIFLHDLQHYFQSGEPEVIDGMPRKVFVFASHDARVVPLLDALGIHDGRIVEYGVSLLFELLQSPDGQLYVRTFFIPDALKAVHENMVPELTRGCPTTPGTDCTAEQFFAGLKDYILNPVDHEKECALA